ncbi:MAG: HD domain-containing phosphohydrolase [Candidatus Omnitrophota bacterium]
MNKNNVMSLSSVGADNLDIGLFRYSLTSPKGFIISNSILPFMLGYVSTNSLFERKLSDLFVHHQDENTFFEILQRNGKIKFFETTFRKANGKTLEIAISASCVFQNSTKCLEGIIQDISCRKEIYDRLLTEKKLLQHFFDNIPDAVYFKDRQNRIVKANKFYIKGTCLEEKDIIGKTDFAFFPYDQAKKMFEDDNYILRTGKPIIGKIEKTLLPNKTWNQVITTKIPMYDDFGQITGTMGTTRDMTVYSSVEDQRIDMAITALEVLGKALELRDPYTFSHTRHVANIAEKIAKILGWSKDRLLGLKLAGELHDLGKISISLDILNKPGKLSDLEYCLIQEHVKNCYNLIKEIEFPFPLAEVIYQHHERLDGSGYPRKLKGNEILPEARILAISDVVEAMTHYRPYRQALGIKKACEELIQGEGIKYDAEAVNVLLGLVKSNNDKEFWKGS